MTDRQTDWQGNAGRCWLRTLTDSDLLFQVPVILLAGLVLTSELHGTFDSSPHNFRPHNLTQIKVSVDSDIYPTSDGIRVDYDQIGGFVEGYLSLAHNRLLADTGITQSFETYKTGFCWYLFSLGKSVVARSVGRSVCLSDMFYYLLSGNFVSLEFDHLDRIRTSSGRVNLVFKPGSQNGEMVTRDGIWMVMRWYFFFS